MSIVRVFKPWNENRSEHEYQYTVLAGWLDCDIDIPKSVLVLCNSRKDLAISAGLSRAGGHEGRRGDCDDGPYVSAGLHTQFYFVERGNCMFSSAYCSSLMLQSVIYRGILWMPEEMMLPNLAVALGATASIHYFGTKEAQIVLKKAVVDFSGGFRQSEDARDAIELISALR